MLVWVNSYPCFWAWVVARLVSLPAFPHGHYPGELSSTAFSSSPNAACSEERGQFCSESLRSRSPLPISLGPALLFCPGKVQGPLPVAAEDMKWGWVCSPALLSSELVYLSSSVLPRWGAGPTLSPTTVARGRGGRPSFLHP